MDEEAKILGGLAEAFELTGNMISALETAEKAVKINRRIYRDYGLMFSCEAYARILAQAGDAGLANEYFDEAVMLAKRCEREDIEARIMRRKSLPQHRGAAANKDPGDHPRFSKKVGF